MRILSWNLAAWSERFSPDQRRVASIASVTHALHDGYTDLIYILLPLWQSEFGLDYAALGVLRSVFVGAMASLQIPAGLVSERLGGRGGARAWYRARRFWLLSGRRERRLYDVACRAVHWRPWRQHAASGCSALVARAFAGPRSLTALGTYNFAGDLGKMILPATLSVMLLGMAWRSGAIDIGMSWFRAGSDNFCCHAALR
jgi:FSR family fosmidomycin resistance protein-like MFS transporter